ncbi:MAG: hypothetical protein PVI57_18370 [Gemmatimonadota bacterium]|jgi:hypothetical protein
MTQDGIEWTDEERAALERLGRPSDPGRLLEEKTVRALRERGLLEAPEESHGASDHRPSGGARHGTGPRRAHPAWWAAGIAAALALFLGGMSVGQWRAASSTRELAQALRAVDAAERASLVQRTGSLWVEALAGLAELQERGEDEAVETGSEVARAALRAAALELARLHPDDIRYARILSTLHPPEEGGAGSETRERVEQVMWF